MSHCVVGPSAPSSSSSLKHLSCHQICINLLFEERLMRCFKFNYLALKMNGTVSQRQQALTDRLIYTGLCGLNCEGNTTLKKFNISPALSSTCFFLTVAPHDLSSSVP